MEKILMIGHAEFGAEKFDFKIGRWSGSVGLLIRRSDVERSVETGAGLWPTVEKAQEIADQTVKKLLNPECSIAWISVST